jgi:hypothetical protein
MQKKLHPGDILSHHEMCGVEGVMLQRGMNFRLRNRASVILMSRRRGAPYKDEVKDDGKTLVYEGHDIPKTGGIRDPKRHDQQTHSNSGRLTENGKFLQAAERFKATKSEAESVRVYEKLRDGIWVFNGVFQLVDAWQERVRARHVFKFKLVVIETDDSSQLPDQIDIEHTRLIPTSVKIEVYKRDRGRCVKCGSSDNLHFDHLLPFSKGGTSIKPENIQLLCARHNLQKRDNIE